MHSLERAIQVYFVSWVDKKPVHMLSTIRSGVSTCVRMVRERKNIGPRIRMVFNIPSIVKWYNKGMGGTDAFDDRLAKFRPAVKTITWLPKVFTHFVNSAVANSYIIYKWFHRMGHRYSEREYLEDLMDELVEEFIMSQRVEEPEEKAEHPSKRRKTWNSDLYRLTGHHFPQTLKLPMDDLQMKQNTKDGARRYQRGHCRLCRNKTVIQCEQCQVFL